MKKIISLFVFYIFFLPILAFAEGVAISPAIIEKNIAPGEKYESSVTVTNPESAEKTFFLSVKDIEDIDESGQPKFSDPKAERTELDASSWFILGKTMLSVPPDSSASVSFTVSVPKNATPGWHAAALFVTSIPPETDEGNASFVGYEVGSLVNLRISGDVKDEIKIREFTTDSFIYFSPKIKFISRLEGVGNTLVRPKGIMNIKDMWGGEIATLELNKGGAAVLPGKIRNLEAEWAGTEYFFGKYQAVASFVYESGGSNRTISTYTNFYIVPFKMTVYTVLAVLFLVFIISALIKHQVKKKMRAENRDVSGQTGNKTSKMSFMILTSILFTLLFVSIILIMFL